MGGGTLPQRLSTIRKVTRLYTTCVAPRVISGAVPRESAAHAALHSPLLILGALCILVTATLVAFSFLSQDQWLLRVRRLVGLPLLFGACTALIFCASTVSASGLLSTCNADFAGRYGTPLVLALPFFFAAVFTMARMSISVGVGAFMTTRPAHDTPPPPTRWTNTIAICSARRFVGVFIRLPRNVGLDIRADGCGNDLSIAVLPGGSGE